jgi:amino acid transporter
MINFIQKVKTFARRVVSFVKSTVMPKGSEELHVSCQWANIVSFCLAAITPWLIPVGMTLVCFYSAMGYMGMDKKDKSFLFYPVLAVVCLIGLFFGGWVILAIALVALVVALGLAVWSKTC